MLSQSEIKPFSEGEVKLTVTPAKDGPIVAFDFRSSVEAIPDEVTERIQNAYKQIGKELGKILYTKSDPDRAYEFGKAVQRRTQASEITQSQLFDIIEFEGVETKQAQLFVEFANLYSNGEYPNDVNPAVVVVLANEHGKQKGKTIVREIAESKYTITDSIAEIWYNIGDYDLKQICEKVKSNIGGDPINAVTVIYRLGDKEPPSEDEIVEHFDTAPTENGNQNTTGTAKLGMTKTTEEERKKSKDKDILSDFSERVSEIRGEYDGEVETYKLGSLIKEFKEGHGLTMGAMAESSPLDVSRTYIGYYLHATEPFTEETFPENMTVSGVYSLVNEYGDNEKARKRILKATSHSSSDINNSTVNYFKSEDEITVERAIEGLSGQRTSTQEVVERVQVVHIFDGQEPPSEEVIYEALDQQQAGEVDQQQAGEVDQQQAGEVDQQQVSKLEKEIPNSILHSEYSEKLIENDEVAYQEDIQTVASTKETVKEEITSEHGLFIPTQSVIEKLSKAIDDGCIHITAATTPDGVENILTSDQTDIEAVSTIQTTPNRNSRKENDETIYDAVANAANPLLISYPDAPVQVAMAIETYANNGGEKLVYIGEQTNNSNPQTQVVQALHNNFDVESITTGIQWKENADAVYVCKNRTNNDYNK